MNFKIITFVLFVLSNFNIFNNVFANDSTFVNIHFLYGSKPKKQFRKTEEKWFGGKLGGHVGIEVYENKVLSFAGYNRIHVFPKKKKNSKFSLISNNHFWEVFGGFANQVKKKTISIPVSNAQKSSLDSLVKLYMVFVPYDYAFFGMRCGSSTYEILSKLNILPKKSNLKTAFKIFYPKKLRRILTRKAFENNWKITFEEGTDRRKWEKD